jgi:hypothetical protein
LRGYECWEQIEGAYIRFLITGPLTWLGVTTVENIASDETSKDSFCLTGAGTSLLGRGEPPLIKIPPRITLDLAGRIDVPRRRRFERYQLSRVAQLVDQNNVFRFRVTPSSLERAKQQRIPLSRIVSFLEQAVEHPLPASLKTAMQRFYRNSTHASLEKHWVLRLPDANDFDNPSLQECILDQLTPSAALIRQQDLLRVLTILTENGILVDVGEL